LSHSFNRKKTRNKIHINIGNHVIENHPKIKILGVIFNHKDSWILYILILKKSTLSRANIIKILANTSQGAQPQNLLKIHKIFILSKLDYGIPIFSTANPTPFKNSFVLAPSKVS